MSFEHGDNTYFAPDEPVSGGISSGQPSDDVEEEKSEEQRIEEIKKELFTREMPEEYQRLIENVQIIEVQEPYSEQLVQDRLGFDNLTEFGKFIADEIKGQKVLDLGCGTSNWVSSFSEKYSAELYIGIDLHPYIFGVTRRSGNAPKRKISERFSLELPEEDPNSSSPNLPEVKGKDYKLEDNSLQVRGDMLGSISRMKAKSMKLIIMSGLETGRRIDDRSTTEEYMSALENEIKRVMTEDGLLLIYESDFWPEDLKPVEIEGYNRGMELWRNNELDRNKE